MAHRLTSSAFNLNFLYSAIKQKSPCTLSQLNSLCSYHQRIAQNFSSATTSVCATWNAIQRLPPGTHWTQLHKPSLHKRQGRFHTNVRFCDNTTLEKLKQSTCQHNDVSHCIRPLHGTATYACNPLIHKSGLLQAPPLYQRMIGNIGRGLQQNNGSKKQAEKHFDLSARAIVESSPVVIQPYLRLMRIDRPIGTWLLFLPCAWSISLSAPPGCLPDPIMLTLFAMGSFFMRGAGCTINDMWDKDFDARVARTKDRPLASGQIDYFKALVFLGAQLSVSLAILLTFNLNTIILGACSLIPCIIYPLMKRVTYWPQIFLGLSFNWGSVMGWCATTGAPDLTIVAPLYLSCIAWTLVYDTIYAHQDKEDDILVGVKSTALGLGERTKPWLAGFTSLMVAGLLGTGAMCDQTWPYYVGMAYVGSHLAHQIYTVDLNNPEECGRKFRSNRNLGLIFWAFIVAGNLLRSEDTEQSKKQVDDHQEHSG